MINQILNIKTNLKKILNLIINLKLHQKETIVVCFAGVMNRSIHLTYNNIAKQILKPILTKYNYDIYVFNNNIENAIIDSVRISNSNLKCVEDILFFEEETQSIIDNNINTKLKNNNWINPFYIWYKGHESYKRSTMAQNALRQLYCENKVAEFLKKSSYKKGIFITPDFYFHNMLDIEKIIFDDDNIYIPDNNDARGYTNGFYIGNVNLLIKIMQRYHYIDILIKDYEYGVMLACNINKINRKILNIYFVKIRADKSIWKNGKKPQIDSYLSKL